MYESGGQGMNREELQEYPCFALEVEARILNMEGTSFSHGRTQDISKAGVNLLSERPVALDAVYTLVFAIPHENGYSNVFALMDPIYCADAEDGSGYRIGFAFRHVGVNHAALILSYITRKQYPQAACPQGRGRALPAYMRGMSPVAKLRSWQEAYRDD